VTASARAAGFDAHLAKPIDPRRFVGQVEAFLPAARPVAEPTAPAVGSLLGLGQVPQHLRAPRPGLAVLMVDDKAHHLEFKRDLLEPAGYEVLCTDGGQAAWELLGSRRIDLVLSDVVMPGVGGFELLARVRADPRFRELRFVFLTSTACDRASMQQGLALGADDYLMRPLDPAALLGALRRALTAPGQG
jgi:CheY-like chemotaxis protein